MDGKGSVGERRYATGIDHFLCLLWCGGVVFLFSPFISTAQEVRVNAHTVSLHIGKPQLNDRTWGGGAEVTWDNRSWQFGFQGGSYYNSQWNLALYLGVSGAYSPADKLHVGLGLAGATGYEFYGVVCMDALWEQGERQWCVRPDWMRLVMPMLWPYVSFGDRVQARVLASPFMGGVGHLMISLRLTGE